MTNHVIPTPADVACIPEHIRKHLGTWSMEHLGGADHEQRLLRLQPRVPLSQVSHVQQSWPARRHALKTCDCPLCWSPAAVSGHAR